MAQQPWTWHHINTDNLDSINQAQEEYGLTAEQLSYAKDRFERAHVEYDVLTKTFLMVFNIPDADGDAAQEEQHQMAFIIKDGLLLSFGHADADPLSKLLITRFPTVEDYSPYQFLLEMLYIVTEQFMPLIEKAEAARHGIAKALRKKTTRAGLLDLSDLETNALYLDNASKQNASVLQQLKGLSIYHGFSEVEQERLEDVLIEANQLVEMTQLGSQNLNQLEGTYNNVLNNNLNDTMKFLTVWSLVLTVPTIISGFFGQNVRVPFEHTADGWMTTIVIAVVLSIIMAIFMNRYVKK
ncbi:magnesium transporter CorA family protein [Lacticaseibacillus pabuli]|uniref:Magnesium transporter CorA family protein n=1 Tax=Lacticaseibacillus pabuli TaxID=3025672 RepID=A0ABY7WR90_9LACO|nr:magnesium transporter CorA family protein [Lacticaseibacillus sp. KACC 23028]WDF81579.1 magnesium transporter CorA family protein [Lacticaseibacillus sp. KACC 23028]